MHRWMSGTPALLALALGAVSVALAGLIPGGGPQRSDCYVELSVQGVDNPGSQVSNSRIVRCTDGDICDADGVCGNDSCTLRVAVCIGQNDPNLLTCKPAPALRRLSANNRLRSALPTTLDGSACGAFVDLPVSVRVRRNGRKLPGMVALPANATAERPTNPARDRDKYVLQCLPNPSCAGVAPTTTTTTLPRIGGTTTVAVGPSSAPFGFAPRTVTIHVGETVRWRWDSSGHDVVSGSGSPDGRFCSPNDRACGSTFSNAGTTYEHTFTEAGTFPYYCSPHVSLGMTGRVIVEP